MPQVAPAVRHGAGGGTPATVDAVTSPTVFAPVAPLLKWPGGKRAELARLVPRFPRTFVRYLEPFVGGGAALFAQPPQVPAAVNDLSLDLMELYRRFQVQDPALFAGLDGFDRWWQDLAVAVERHGAAVVDLFGMPHVSDGSLVAAVERWVTAHLEDLTATVPGPWGSVAPRFQDALRRTVPGKVRRMRRLQVSRGHRLPPADVWRNLEGAVKAAAYTAVRAAYNGARRRGERSAPRTAAFYVLREYAYAAMFRFNAAGDFNVPYGGVSYNRKDLTGKLAHARSEAVVARLATTTLCRQDFEAFLDEQAPTADDFVFLDPPYDTTFSAYDGNGFGPADHRRLAARLARLPCRFQLVIRDTPLVAQIYSGGGWHRSAADTTYRWTIKARNDRRATHLVITNYEPPSVD